MRYTSDIFPQSIVRCTHVKVNGVQCGSPALKDKDYCYFHQRWRNKRIQIGANQARRRRFSLDLPVLEDANSVQVALMQGLRLLLSNQIDQKTASLLFYALQTASSNLGRVRFEPARPQEVVIDLKGVPDTNLGDDAWYKSEFRDPPEAAGSADDDSVDIQAVADPGPPAQRRHTTTHLRAEFMRHRVSKQGHFAGRGEHGTINSCEFLHLQ